MNAVLYWKQKGATSFQSLRYGLDQKPEFSCGLTRASVRQAGELDASESTRSSRTRSFNLEGNNIDIVFLQDELDPSSFFCTSDLHFLLGTQYSEFFYSSETGKFGNFFIIIGILVELVNSVYKTMSFVFRGTRSDLESGFPGFIPERRVMRVRTGRTVNSNSLVFLVTVLLLFMILNSHQMSPNFLLWLVLGVFLMATTLRMYASCIQLQAQAQAHAAAASGLLGHTELRLHMPSSIALATRGRLQGLRLQLALLDREFDDLDYETLRALDADNVPSAASMSEEEINALPVHKYKVSAPQSSDASMQQASSSNSPQKKQDPTNPVGRLKGSEDELTCSVCLEQVNVGDLIRSLPCLHQFHAGCIDPWLRQQGTCPVCKFRAGSGWQETRGIDASYMV